MPTPATSGVVQMVLYVKYTDKKPFIAIIITIVSVRATSKPNDGWRYTCYPTVVAATRCPMRG